LCKRLPKHLILKTLDSEINLHKAHCAGPVF
jgi:hypothetical protein